MSKMEEMAEEIFQKHYSEGDRDAEFIAEVYKSGWQDCIEHDERVKYMADIIQRILSTERVDIRELKSALAAFNKGKE